MSRTQLAACSITFHGVDSCMKWSDKVCLGLCTPEHHSPLPLCVSQINLFWEGCWNLAMQIDDTDIPSELTLV
jgi:hypothetical protein